MNNLSSRDRIAINKIIADMKNSGAVQFMFEQTNKLDMLSFCKKWLYKRYVHRMNFTSKQLTIAIMMYNRQCQLNKEGK